MDLKKHGGAAASVPGVNGPSQSWAFICRKHKQMALFFQSREGRKPEQTGWVCSVCASAHAREKKREEEEQREKAEKERSKQGVCFWISVWEVEPHLPRMPCLTPCSPLRFLGASLFFAASKLWYYLFISHLQLFWESLEMVTWCEASLWSVMHNLYLPLTVQHCWQWSDEVRWKKSLLKSQLEPWLNLTIEDSR